METMPSEMKLIISINKPDKIDDIALTDITDIQKDTDNGQADINANK